MEHAQLMDNGLLLRAVRTNLDKWDGLPMIHGLLEMVDWNGNVVWSFKYANDKHVLHHDFTVLPNGNLMMCSYDSISKDEVIAAGRDPRTIDGDDMVVERIIEVKPDYENGGGDIVWSWSTWDHLSQDFDKTKENYYDVASHPELFDLNYYRQGNGRYRDWNHVNAVDYNEELDMIMVTVHINDEVVLIDHSTAKEEAAGSTGGRYGKGGDVLYRWGNPAAYRAGSTSEKRYNALHNAHWIPEGVKDAGKVLVLNNNFRGESSVLELVELPFNMGGKDIDMSAPIKATTVYDDFHTSNMGGSQRLPNGNTLINEAVKGRTLEVTSDEKLVWEYVNPAADAGPVAQGDEIPPNPRSGDLYNEMFLTYRLGLDHPALFDKDLTPKGLIEKPAGTK